MITKPLEHSLGKSIWGVKELIVVEAIWETIIQVVAIVAELFCMDQEKLLSLILLDNRRLKAMRELAQTASKLLPKFE